MKIEKYFKSILSLLLFLFFIQLTVSAQSDLTVQSNSLPISVVAKAGLTSSKFGFDYGSCVNQKFGGTAGVELSYKINDKFGVGFEGLYSLVGARGTLSRLLYTKPATQSNLDLYYSLYNDISLQYAQIPLFATYSMDNFKFRLGGGMGILLAAKSVNLMEIQIGNVSSYTNTQDDVKKQFQNTDAFGLIGAAYTFNKISIEARYQFGLTNVNVMRSGETYYSVTNNTFSVTVGYKLY